MTFGLVIHDKKLFLLGLKNNIISLMMCVVPGFIIGLITFCWSTEWNPPPNGKNVLLEKKITTTFFAQAFGPTLKCRAEALTRVSSMAR